MTASGRDEAQSRLGAHNAQKGLCLLPVLLLPLLGGCHADVTVRFEVHGGGSALVTTKEIIDDELYNLASSQGDPGDPFYTKKLQRQGWLISTDIDESRNHVITISKLINRNAYKDLAHASPILSNITQSLGTVEFSRAPGLFFERDSLSATIAPLMPLILSNFSRSYVGIASELLSSALALHLEMKSSGKVLATNGTLLPDGTVRWDLNLEEPTTVEYSARMVDWFHVALAVFGAFILGAAISTPQFRSSARTLRRRWRVPIQKC